MGRRRRNQIGIPQRLRLSHGAWYHVDGRGAQRLAAHSDVRTTRGYYADVPRVRL